VIRREPKSARLIQDGFRLAFTLIIVGALFATWTLLPRLHPPWIDVIARTIAVLLVEVLVVAGLRSIVPVPFVGSHRVGRDKPYVRWLASTALSEVATNIVIAWPFSFLHSTRFVLWRALGANMSFGAGFSYDLKVRDPSLLVVEHGAQLEHGVVIEHGLHARGRIRVDAVHISGGALIGAGVILNPGVSVGHDARVSPRAYVGPDVAIGVGTRIGERAVIAAGVDIGAHARIGAGVVVSEGVRVGDHARLLAGAVIPPNTVIREREVWRGIGARPVFREEQDENRVISRF